MSVISNDYSLRSEPVDCTSMIENSLLLPGTIIAIEHTFYEHLAIVSDTWKDGYPLLISHSYRNKGVREEHWKECTQGKKVRIIGYPGNLPYTEVLARARLLIYEEYNWNMLTQNCEHFVYLAHGVSSRSPQIQNAVTSAVLGGLIGWVLSNGDVKKAVKSAALGAGLCLAVKGLEH